jgi:hypothetical protein
LKWQCGGDLKKWPEKLQHVVYIVNDNAVKVAFLNCMGYTVLNGRIVKMLGGCERKQSVYLQVLLQLSLLFYLELHSRKLLHA